jgi:hypothetical protein
MLADASGQVNAGSSVVVEKMAGAMTDAPADEVDAIS